MTDAELSEALTAAQTPPPAGTQAAVVDWLPLVLEVLRRLLERRNP